MKKGNPGACRRGGVAPPGKTPQPSPRKTERIFSIALFPTSYPRPATSSHEHRSANCEEALCQWPTMGRGYWLTERIFSNVPFSYFHPRPATSALSTAVRGARRRFVKGGPGVPPARFGYFSAKESNCPPRHEGQAEGSAKSCDNGTGQKA
jgi:hypothetical protein